MLLKRLLATAAACTLAGATGCSSDSNKSTSTETTTVKVETGKPFPTTRCADNRAAGKITYVSSFDFAAAAGIVDVLVAKQKGYFDAMCLDVDVVAGSNSPGNYASVAGNAAQFSSGGSFSEVENFRVANPGADVVVLAVEGKASLGSLIVKAGTARTVTDLRGTTIGVHGTMPPCVRAMLAAAGLVEGTDYQIVALDGTDPTQNIALPEVAGFVADASDEPGQLERAGIAFTAFDAATDGIPGSFGLLYTNRRFIDAHPTAAQDFMRASMQGLADAIADPRAASMIALDFIDNNGNPESLNPDGETFRWQTQAKLVADATPKGEPVGLPNSDMLQSEVKAYAAIGLFGGTAPDISAASDASILRAIYDSDNLVIWPAK